MSNLKRQCLHWSCNLIYAHEINIFQPQEIVCYFKWNFAVEIDMDTERHYRGICFSLLPIGKSVKLLLGIRMPITNLLPHLQSSKQQNPLMLQALPDNWQSHLTVMVSFQSGACKRFKNQRPKHEQRKK